MVIGHRAVGIAVELRQTVYEIPYFPVAGMEDMGAVFMHMDTFHILTVNISADMVPPFYHQALLSLLTGQIGKHTVKQTASYQYIIIFLHFLYSPCL